jgi:DNA-directed RNA polymerase subunit RPC12/RpoP
MAWIYRCSRCRTRNTFRRAVHDYIIKRKCRHCGHRRFYVDKERVRRKPCKCAGYHHPHRMFSKFCDHRPESIVHRAAREGTAGEALWDVAMEAAWSGGRVTDVCPF